MDAGRTREKGGADAAAYDVPGSLTHHFYNFP